MGAKGKSGNPLDADSARSGARSAMPSDVPASNRFCAELSTGLLDVAEIQYCRFNAA
jgi:hypothetical protein